MKRILLSILVFLTLATPGFSAQYYGRLNGWDIRSSCTAYVTTGVGCYDSTAKTFCIGNGTSCVVATTTANISDTAYDATSWDGVTTIAPSKNAVRDKFESLATGVSIATAGGTADVITATFSPVPALADKTLLAFVASGANTTTTPSFSPNSLTAHTIVKKGGVALVAGDIPGALAVCVVEYNLANTRWELLNPAFPIVMSDSTSTTSSTTAASATAVKAAYDLANAAATAVNWPGSAAVPPPIGSATPAAGTFSPSIAQGPAIDTTCTGTVTATASKTVTFSLAADAAKAGWRTTAADSIKGTTLISNAITRYIESWTNATTAVVDSAVTWAGTAITSVKLPIATFVNSAGVTQGWMNAAGNVYFVGNLGVGANPSYTMQTLSNNANMAQWYYAGEGSVLIKRDSAGNFYLGTGSTNEIMHLGSEGIKVITMDAVQNVGINTQTFGTSAAKVLAMGSGTAPTTSPADAFQEWVADHGGVGGKATKHFVDEAGNYGSLGNASITVGSGTGVTVALKGHLNRQMYKVTTAFGAYTDSDTTKGIIIATLPAKMKIVGFYADTTVAYSGGAVSAATLEVGVTAEGAAEIIAAHDVKTAAVTKGLADADMGTGMTRAAQIQGGYMPSWSGTTAIYATIDTTDGNLNALTAGSTTFYIETEQF